MPKKATPVVTLEWLTKQQAADALGVCTKTIERYAKEGKITFRKPSPGVFRISAASLERLMS